jgi:hypothetical protein
VVCSAQVIGRLFDSVVVTTGLPNALPSGVAARGSPHCSTFSRPRSSAIKPSHGHACSRVIGSLLPGGRWPQQLSSLFRARLVETFQNAGLARSLAGDGARADYELDLDIRAVELDAATNRVHVDVAARNIDVNSGRVADVQIVTERTPVASSDAAAVATALDQTSATIMTRIVRFVAKRL